MSFEDPETRRLAQAAAGRADPGEGLLGPLRAKLRELADRGYAIRWITAGPEELTRLFREGGDDIVRIDAGERAWLDGYEFRPTATPGLFVYLEGEYDEMSRHGV